MSLPYLFDLGIYYFVLLYLTLLYHILFSCLITLFFLDLFYIFIAVRSFIDDGAQVPEILGTFYATFFKDKIFVSFKFYRKVLHLFFIFNLYFLYLFVFRLASHVAGGIFTAALITLLSANSTTYTSRNRFFVFPLTGIFRPLFQDVCKEDLKR